MKFPRNDLFQLFFAGNLHMRSVRDSNGNLISLEGFIEDNSERTRVEEELIACREELASLAAELSNAEEKERRRIAGDLHDDIGQSLALSSLKLSVLKSKVPPEQAVFIEDIKELLDGSIEAIRSLTIQLNSPILYGIGLEAALTWLCQWFHNQYGLVVVFCHKGENTDIHEELRSTLFQCVREIIINVAKHAKTDKTWLSISTHENLMTLEIKDQGRGFNVSEILNQQDMRHGFGLFNVRHRIEHLNGVFIIESSIGAGTRILLKVPLSPYN